MFFYDKNDIIKGIDPAESNDNEQCIVCHYRFFNHSFELQDSLCNVYHDLVMLCLNISSITIVTVIGIDYCCIIHSISKSEAIHLLENSVLEDRGYI